MTSLATRLPVAQWLECPTGVREVMGSIPVGDSDFFFVPRSRQTEYSIFLNLQPLTKIFGTPKENQPILHEFHFLNSIMPYSVTRL